MEIEPKNGGRVYESLPLLLPGSLNIFVFSKKIGLEVAKATKVEPVRSLRLAIWTNDSFPVENTPGDLSRTLPSLGQWTALFGIAAFKL